MIRTGPPVVEIYRDTLDKIIKRSLALMPEESCGAILRGEDFPISNVSPNDRTRTFQLDPVEQLGVWTNWGGKGDLMIYHSHPKGSPNPSRSDTEVMLANPNIVFLIFAPQTGWVGAYQAVGGFIRRVSVEIKERS